jgi:calcineurin-like phosphoesterase family protein
MGAALMTPFAGSDTVRAKDGPAFRFGLIADPQYAPIPPENTRHFANSLAKVAEAVEDFNGRDLAFVVTLGDIIDRGWESYGHVLPIYDRLKAPNHFVLGNHDYEVASEHLASVERVTGLERAHYDFAGGGYRFVVLDGNDVSLFANPPHSDAHALAAERLARMTEAGAINAKPWSGGLSDEQFDWIETAMMRARGAGERVIVLCHYPVWPADMHNLWDDARLVDLLTSYDNVVLYLNGHNHAGNYGQIGRTHFVNLRGMVETADTTAYTIAEVRDDRIDLIGRGREASRTLAI